jgi:hypothetical protein
MAMASMESEACSFKPVPNWVKFHYPYRLHSSGGVPQESGKAHSLLRLPTFSSSWLKAKVLRHSHSTTVSEDGKEHHIASDNGDESSDNGDESAGTEQAVFGLSECKQVKMGLRISGASADSLVAEKQEA